jgi:signal recognition particle subunit SRP68
VTHSKFRYVSLQLLTAERAWANAMAMKALHSADTKGISGKSRSHIVSRLDKGAKAATQLANTLAQGSSGASKTDVLEARAYASLLMGAAQFEKQAWKSCLTSYSVARLIYSALSTSAKADVFKDLLSDTIDPSIRYAAYQLKIPRTRPIPAIALEAFPRSDTELVRSLRQVDSRILESGDADAEAGVSGPDGTPSTITWRSREVKIEDAAIAVAWGTVAAARSQLDKTLESDSTLLPKDMAAVYDDILTATQDAVDATKHAIDELKAEGVPQSDPRMQSLQITRTAVNYEMISWRIGRNRVLVGAQDGAKQDTTLLTKRQLKRAEAETDKRKDEAPGRRIARLKEKVVLYDGILQSLESVQELPGVAADEELSSRVGATFSYFEALK